MNRLQSYGSSWLAKAPVGQFWTYFCAGIFFNFGFSIFFFLFNIYLLGFGLNERALGLIGSCMAGGSLLSTIPTGIFAERLGLRWTLTGGLALAVATSVLRVCIPWQPAQLVLAVVSGMALCINAVCLSPTVAALTTEQQRPFAFSLLCASGIGVCGVGALFAGWLPGWLSRPHELLHSVPMSLMRAERATLLFACGVAALAIFPMSRLTLRSATPRAPIARPPTPFLLRFLPAMAVWGLVTGAFPPFANVYFVHHLGMSLQAMGSVFSLSQFVQFLAVLGAPWLFRRMGLAPGVMLTQLATAVLLACLAHTHTLAHATWLYWAYLSAQNMNEPGIFSLLMNRVPADERNGASSYTFFISSGSQLIASFAVGTEIVHYGYSVVLWSIASLAVVAALLFWRLSHSPGTAALPAPVIG